MEVLLNDWKFLSLKVTLGNLSNFIFTAVYLSPNSTIRHGLCEKLSGIAAMNNGPWLIAGDFNEVLHPWEKSSGVVPRHDGRKRFKCWVEEYGMRDLGSRGSKYTRKRRLCYSSKA